MLALIKEKMKTLISFTGIKHGSGAVEVNEFYGLTKNYNVFFIKDTDRSWYNTLNTKRIIKGIDTSHEIICIGNSMGGFNATMFALDYPVSKVIAFATQYSIYPELVPWDTRYLRFAKKVTNWKVKHLDFNDTTQYHFISGDEETETRHLNMIPDKDNITKTVIEGSGHKVSKDLKDRHELYPIIDRILAS